MRNIVTTAALAAGLVLAVAAPALAATPAGPPPSWEVLSRCAEAGDDASELNCYREAMHAAGYATTPVAASERRRRFGLTMPHIGLPKGRSGARAGDGAAAASQAGSATTPSAAETGDDADRVVVKLEQIATIPPAGKLLLVTTDGAIWEQLDTEDVSPRPRPGQAMVIQRNRFGGFFCKFGKLTAVRCRQTH